MSYIVDITCNERLPTTLNILTSLSESHGLSDKEIRVLQQLYSQHSVVMQPYTHSDMLKEVLNSILIKHSDLLMAEGLVIYAKTQTHNTMFDQDWLGTLIKVVGLTRWSGFTFSMNHCASGLSALHLVSRLYAKGETRPIIVLCGEKSLAPFNKMSVSALGEIATAIYLHPTQGRWHITASEVKHLGAYYSSPEHMSRDSRKSMMDTFYPSLRDFLQRQPIYENTAIIPYNLNLPILKRLARDCGWGERMYLENLSSLGHTFCSDVFINLITYYEDTDFNDALMFAAGMGITFSAVHIERNIL